MLAALGTAGGVAIGAIAASGSVPQPAAAGLDSVAVKTVRYGTHERNVMDVFTPKAAVGKVGQKRGTVLLIHGGSWVQGDKSGHDAHARQLARRGYVVASMNYRFATQAAWPAQRTDGLAAVHYLRSHARPLNADRDRIVLIGWSAGAHIASSVATYRRGGDLVAGVVGLSGPFGMRRTAADSAGGLDAIVTKLLLRCEPQACARRYSSATPIWHLTPGDAPILLFSSRHEWVNPQNSVDLVNRARAKGLSARMAWIPGDDHAGYWDTAWPAIREWVDQRMAPSTGH